MCRRVRCHIDPDKLSPGQSAQFFRSEKIPPQLNTIPPTSMVTRPLPNGNAARTSRSVSDIFVVVGFVWKTDKIIAAQAVIEIGSKSNGGA